MADNAVQGLLSDPRGEMRASPRNKLMGLLADALGSANQFATQNDPRYADKRQNQTLGLLADAVSLGSLAKTADRMSYGAPLTNARQANVPWLKPETADALMMAPLSPRMTLGMLGIGTGVADSGMLKSMLLYHGTNSAAPLKTIERGGGPFGGLFAGSEGVAGSHGKFTYRMTVPDEKILGQNTDLGTAALNFVRAKMGNKLHADDLGPLAEIIASGKGDPPSHLVDFLSKQNPYGEMGAPLGDAGWYLQRLRGELAQSLGYKAAAMSDEHGATYLVNGANPRPYNQAAKDLARGIQPPPYIEPAPYIPAKNWISLDRWRALPESEKAARAGDISGRLRGADREDVGRYSR